MNWNIIFFDQKYISRVALSADEPINQQVSLSLCRTYRHVKYYFLRPKNIFLKSSQTLFMNQKIYSNSCIIGRWTDQLASPNKLWNIIFFDQKYIPIVVLLTSLLTNWWVRTSCEILFSSTKNIFLASRYRPMNRSTDEFEQVVKYYFLRPKIYFKSC